MSRRLADALRWSSDGTELVRRALAASGTTDVDLDAPSALPGWTRKHLLAHLAANADAVANLVRWASTGVETPMYASMQQRNDDIAAGGSRPAAELVGWFDSSAATLADGFSSLSVEQWEHEVVTAQGRTVPASETPWMRSREVMVHAVDLDAGVTFADLPADFLEALGTDIATKRSASAGPALRLSPTNSPVRLDVAGDGEPTPVSGPLADVVSWLAGRPASAALGTADGSALPTLPPWL